MAIIFTDLYILTMIIRYDIDTDNWNAPYVLPRSSSLKTSLFLLRDVVAKPSLAYHGGFYMPRLFYPPLVEPGVLLSLKAPTKKGTPR